MVMVSMLTLRWTGDFLCSRLWKCRWVGGAFNLLLISSDTFVAWEELVCSIRLCLLLYPDTRKYMCTITCCNECLVMIVLQQRVRLSVHVHDLLGPEMKSTN